MVAGASALPSWPAGAGAAAAYCRSIGSSTETGPDAADSAWPMPFATVMAISSADAARKTAFESDFNIEG